MNDFAIITDNLSRSFSTVRAVDSVTLEIPRGIVFGFLGPNGAGKTTTIRLLLGLLKPDGGRAEVLGFDTGSDGEHIRERTGALLEHTGLYERLNAEDNLEFYGRVYRIPTGERHNRIREILTHFDLWDRRKDRVGEWSRGMKQKLAIARALLHRPSLLFLDEPTAGLDPIAAAGLRDNLAGLVADEGLTVFLNTHNLAEAEKLCTSVGVINRGRLVTVGRPDSLLSGGKTVRAEIVCKNITDTAITHLKNQPGVMDVTVKEGGVTLEIEADTSLSPVVRLLVQEGVDIEEVRREKASLEEAFLTLLKEEEPCPQTS